MRKRRAEPPDLVGMAERPVDALQFLKLFVSAGKVIRRIRPEEIALTYHHEQGLRRYRIEQVPAVETHRSGSNQILLSIVGGTRRIEIRAGDVFGDAARDYRRREPVID